MNYYDKQRERLGVSERYTIKIDGDIDSTNYMDITPSQLDRIFDILNEDVFTCHGVYSMGYDGVEIEISKCGDGARTRSSDGLVSEWVEIEYRDIPNDDGTGGALVPVIPLYGDIPLNEVVRVHI
jgi:hypothetical protein